MIKAVVFDLDGTLLDTIKEIDYIANLSVTHFGYNKVELENVKKYIGDGAINLIERMLLESGVTDREKIEEVYSFYTKKYKELEGDKIGQFEGVIELLDSLERKGIRLSVLSNKPTVNVKNALNKCLSHISFDYVIGGGEYPLKPDPTSLEVIREKYLIEKNEILYVGDGDADVLVAKNANVKSVSVLWGYRSKEELIAAGAERFSSTPKELLDYILLN